MIYMFKVVLFENFGNTYDTYELDPANFLSAPGLVWQAV